MNLERLHTILLAPIDTEKTAQARAEANQYVFKVLPDATKREISRAVELMFDVKVADVQVLNVKGKHKRFGRREGRRSDWRKAYVRLQSGEHINLGGEA
ncbi:50S ribosomal protein L23 [Rhabdochromatium marinum]|uniref:50S ribosomal protein L23 n=1 Tax=Rhabdochromatium marinum TaxID=48729 RepID=UPI001904DFD2|nr:50S ribosomal protein L23 [Rhabdochromatium marinum]MBK1648107.1 50S ribosomal protein L23 [Rhabdochromatium marinum]